MNNIQFKSIEMKNFRSHEDASIEFKNNELILISGANGSGKTSLVIDSTIYALYDETSKGIKGDDIVCKRSGRNKNCEVILKFQIGEDEYRIENYRKHKVHSNKKYLYKNNVDISGVDVKTTNQMIEQLVMSKNLFINCVLFSQYINNKSFTSMSHSDQKDILDKIIGLDKYDEYKDKFTEEIKNVEQQLADLKNINQSYIIERDLIKDTFEKDRLELDSKNEAYNTKKSNIEDQINKLVDETDALDINEELINKLQETLGKLKEQLNQYEDSKLNKQKEINNQLDIELDKLESTNNINKLKIKEEYSKKIKEVEDKINKLRLEYKTVESNYKTEETLIESDIKNIKTELHAEYKKDCGEFDIKISNETNKKEILESQLSNVTSELSSLEKEIKQFKSALKNKTDAKCPVCKQTMGKEDRKHIEDHLKEKEKEYSEKNNVDQLKEKIEEHKKNRQKLSCDKAALYNTYTKDETEKTNALVKKLKKVISDKETELIKIKSQAVKIDNTVELKSEQNKLLESCDTDCLNKSKELSKKYDELYKKSIIEIDEKIEKIKEKYIKVNSDLSKQKAIEDEFTDKMQMLSNLKTSLDIMSKNRKEFIDNFKVKTKEVYNKLKEFEVKIKEYESKKSELNENLDILKFWKNAFGDTGIKSILMDEIVPILNHHAIKLTENLDTLRIRFNSQSTLKSGDQRNKFTVDVVHSKNLSGLSELSAGELRIVNIIVLLCLRHLLEHMNGVKINLLLLDEILDSLDINNSQLVVDLLKNIVKGYSIILISHTHKDWIAADQTFML